jgi:membrane-bound lytic murein transglycosylase D
MTRFSIITNFPFAFFSTLRPTLHSMQHSALMGAAACALLAGLCGCATAPTDAPPAAEPEAPRELAMPVITPESDSAPAATIDNPLDAGPNAPFVARSRLDPVQDAERGDLWLRVRSGFAMPDLDNDFVHKWEQWYARDPAYVQRMTERGGRYLFHVMEEVEKRNMPAELALLPFIESAFNPQALSHARAAGMWQFMPATGKDFELRQNIFRDDRRDVLASTRAALDYLQRLYGLFNDWHLALAAYNWGQGNVTKALERNRKAGLPLDYENLRMPNETREYVPKLQAVKNIVLKPQNFSLSLPAFDNHPFFLSVAIERDIDVELAAKLSGLSLEEFQQLNPQMNQPVILAAGTPRVLLPYDNANRFLQQMALHRGAMASWTAWVAPKTLKPAEAAHITGMNEALLREVNRIPPRMLVKVGSTLLVPRAPHSQVDVSEQVADNAMLSLAQEPRPLRKVSFRAGRQGTTVAAVARQYRVSTAQVAQWNGVTAQGHFKAGQAVTVMLPAGATANAVAAAAAAATAVRPASQAKPKAHAAPQRRTGAADQPRRKAQAAPR